MTTARGAAGKGSALACCAVVVLAVAATLVAFYLTGGRLHRIETPSMAQTAPVGSLVVVTPGQAHVGDIVTFTPTNADHTYTHRIVGETDRGFQTKGDLNGAVDPWTIAQSDVEGIVRAIFPGLGYLLQSAPILLFGALLTWAFVRRVVPAPWRWPVRLLGFPLTFGCAAMSAKPWTGVDMLGYQPDPQGGVTASVVSTGLLPIHVHGIGGTTVDLVSGQKGLVSTAVQGADGRYHFTPSLDLPLAGWVVLAIVCAVPAVLGTALVLRDMYRERAEAGEGRFGTHRRDRLFAGSALAIPLAVVSVVFSLIATSSSAGFAASIRGTGNVKGTRVFFTCADSVLQPQATYTGSPLITLPTSFAYILHSGRIDESDYSPVGDAARWNTAPGTTTNFNDAGCKRDFNTKATTVSNNCLNKVSTTAKTPPTAFTVEFWFRSTQKPSGRIIGFSNSRTSTAETARDRQIYLDASGRIVAQIGSVTVASTAGVDLTTTPSTTWHHVMVSVTPSQTLLFIDGKQNDIDTTNNTGMSTTAGWWRVACTTGTATVPNSTGGTFTQPAYFNGAMDNVVVYSSALGSMTAQTHYQGGTF